MKTGPIYFPKNHPYKPFQATLGGHKVAKYPPLTIFVTPELFTFSRDKLKVE